MTIMFANSIPIVTGLLAKPGRGHARFCTVVARAERCKEDVIKVVGCGGVGVDYLASVAEYPKPDEKLRTERLEVQGGGNTGNASTAAARLGLSPWIISVIGDDSLGDDIVKDFLSEGVNTSGLVRAESHPSPFTYIIVDRKGATRTCIHTPGAAMSPEMVSAMDLETILGGAKLVYFDGRLTEAAIEVAKAARQRGIPCLVEAERLRPSLEELMEYADFLTTSANFPTDFTGIEDTGDAVLATLMAYPRANFIVTTLGTRGAVLVERWPAKDDAPQEAEARSLSGVIEELRRSMPASGEPPVGDGGRVACRAGPAGDVAVVAGHAAGTDGPVKLSLSDASRGPLVDAVRGAAAERAAALNADEGAAERYRGKGGASSEGAGGRAGGEEDCVVARVFVSTAAGLPDGAVADTTGAGDAFNGALVYGLAHGMGREAMLKLAAVVAAAKCTQLGARPGLPMAGSIDGDLLA